MRLFLLALGFAVAQPWSIASAAGPQPPCAGSSVPAFGAIDGPPAIGLWTNGELVRDGWQPPACLGWHGDSRLVAALAARFHSPLALDALAAQLVAVSHHASIRYWSASRQEWRPLATEAYAVDGPDGAKRRRDPAPAELVSGRDFYYAERSDIGGRVVWRLRVLERTNDRLVLVTENVTPISAALVSLFGPGALQVASVLQRDGAGTWTLYGITRAGGGSSSFVSGYGSSFLNRLEAMRRHLAGLPTDRDPPIAPR